MSPASDFDDQSYDRADATVRDLLAGLPRAYAATADDPGHREWLAALRHVAQMLMVGRVNTRVIHGLARLCPCDTGPDTDGPQQECPVHGDGQAFVGLCRWRDAVVGGTHALVSVLADDRPDVAVDVPAVARLAALLDAGPWAGPETVAAIGEVGMAQTTAQLAERVTEVDQVATAWLALLEANPDARTLGGPRSRALWAALDAMVQALGQPAGRSDGAGS